MFGDVVMEISKSKFDKIFDGQKEKVGAEYDVDLSTDDLKEIIVGYKALVKEEIRMPIHLLWLTSPGRNWLHACLCCRTKHLRRVKQAATKR